VRKTHISLLSRRKVVNQILDTVVIGSNPQIFRNIFCYRNTGTILSTVSKITSTTVTTYHRNKPLNLNELGSFDDILPLVFTDFKGFKQVIVPSTTFNYSLVSMYLL